MRAPSRVALFVLSISPALPGLPSVFVPPNDAFCCCPPRSELPRGRRPPPSASRSLATREDRFGCFGRRVPRHPSRQLVDVRRARAATALSRNNSLKSIALSVVLRCEDRLCNRMQDSECPHDGIRQNDKGLGCQQPAHVRFCRGGPVFGDSQTIKENCKAITQIRRPIQQLDVNEVPSQ